MMALLGLVACSSGLSKEDAKKVITAEIYGGEDGDKMHCSVFFQSEGSGENRTYKGYEHDHPWVDALAKKKLVKPEVCIDDRFRKGRCPKPSFTLTDLSKHESSDVTFVCGSREVTEVTSVTTEDRRATAKYKRVNRPDKDLLAALDKCKVKAPDPGEAELTRVLLKDDAGTWHVEKK